MDHREDPVRNSRMAGITKIVFVGNLPYSHSEEQLADVFSRVGPVANFRIAFEKDSGKPRGFGFCEYYDPQTAEAAVRNLQNVEVGGRELRLDFADVPSHDPREPGGRPPPPGLGPGITRSAPGGRGMGGGPGPGQARNLPPDLPRGIPLQPGQPATDSISQTLATMMPEQLTDIMSQMKQLVNTSPDQARALLNSNPQLTYAIFQSMLMLGVVDATVLSRMMGPPAAAAGPPLPQGIPPQNNPMPPFGGGGYGMPPPKQQPQPPQRGMPPFGGPPGPGYGGPVPPPPMGQPGPPPPVANPQQAQLIAQVMALTDEQIAALPPDQKVTIMQIRQQATGMR